MGKSEGNGIYLYEEPAEIRKKVMKAVTDAGPTMLNQEKPVPIQNLFTLMKIVSAPEVVEYYEDQYNNCRIRYGDMKKQLADDIAGFTAPIRERILEISSDQNYLSGVARKGAGKARESASKTLAEVKALIGLKKLY
jgi:tryptophanyl-tRNA synthetase